MAISLPAPGEVCTHRVDQAPAPLEVRAAGDMRCAACNLGSLCRHCILAEPDMAMTGEMPFTRKRVKHGEILYRAGGRSDCLYAIRSGFFKSSFGLDDGREQVTAFRMAGEVLGLDGIDSSLHASQATALEDSEVCIIPLARLDEPQLQRQLYKAMSRELVRDHSVMLLLGMMSSGERLAVFLLNLSQRFAARGLSSSEFHLRMTRAEIGSYLGVSLETVSRLFSRFQEDRLIHVAQNHVRILDHHGLRMVAFPP
jgi:CRP/FNR family transcriptional regulator, anaerobic regulatory protein